MAEKKPAKMSDADLKFFEEMLLEKRRQLVAAQNDSEDANVFQSQKNQSGDTGDPNSSEFASDVNALETNFKLADREGKYLVYLEEALTRIRKGTFGVCKVCKKLIPKARLIAVPTATKCVNCKEETKRKERDEARMEMAKIFAEEQRKEMLRKQAGR
ncbi:MAG: TraR/DksA C4-type zinc finger protein [Fibrobacteraceae bacterium]|nr:TraR/DksA C4-type zinc finger protein [Fibrobacteraceae bacterium]